MNTQVSPSMVFDTTEAIREFTRLSVVQTLKLHVAGIRFKRNTLGNIRRAYNLRSQTARGMLAELTERGASV